MCRKKYEPQVKKQMAEEHRSNLKVVNAAAAPRSKDPVPMRTDARPSVAANSEVQLAAITALDVNDPAQDIDEDEELNVSHCHIGAHSC